MGPTSVLRPYIDGKPRYHGGPPNSRPTREESALTTCRLFACLEWNYARARRDSSCHSISAPLSGRSSSTTFSFVSLQPADLPCTLMDSVVRSRSTEAMLVKRMGWTSKRYATTVVDDDRRHWFHQMSATEYPDEFDLQTEDVTRLDMLS